MWCTTISNTCSSWASSNRSARTGDSLTRSKPRCAAWASCSGRRVSSLAATESVSQTSFARRTCCRGTPPLSRNTVRRLSCRPTTSSIAHWRARRSSSPRSRSASGMLYVALGPSSWCRNHRRRCAKDSGTSSGRSCGSSAGLARPASRRCSASAATVGASNSTRTASSAPSVARIREISRVASSEWPPRSKKLSSTPTWARPSTSANSPASSCSWGVLGSRPVPAEPRSGAGRAARSSLPLAVSGSASSRTNADGTR